MSAGVVRADESAEYWFEEGCFILELSNSESDPALSIARARVPEGGATVWHCLHDTTERYVILEGAGRMEVGESASTVAQGDLVVVPAGVAQRITNTGSGDLVFLALCTPRFQPGNYVRLASKAE